MAWAGLVWGSSCVGCSAEGPAICPPCADRLWAPRVVHPPHGPGPAVGVLAGGPYAGALRQAVVRHKEDGVRELGRTLSAGLAGLLSAWAPSARVPVLLVPVPSRARATRERADDPWLRVARGAARHWPPGTVRVGRLLRVAGRVEDQSGLGPEERQANLAGAMSVRPAVLRRLARATRTHGSGEGAGAVRVVVCDDVVTTGATLAEAVRALQSAGVRVHGCVALSAAELRSLPDPTAGGTRSRGGPSG